MGDLAPDKTTYTPQEQAQLGFALARLTIGIQHGPSVLLTLQTFIAWHATLGAQVPRIEPGRLRSRLRMRASFGRYQAVPPDDVDAELQAVFDTLKKMVASIDDHLDQNPALATDPTLIRHIVASSVWLHANLVRIHPFADGNGRLSRLAQTWLLARYGLPAVVFDDPGEYLAAINCYHDTAPRYDTGPLVDLCLTKLTAAQQKIGQTLLVRYRPNP